MTVKYTRGVYCFVAKHNCDFFPFYLSLRLFFFLFYFCFVLFFILNFMIIQRNVFEILPKESQL